MSHLTIPLQRAVAGMSQLTSIGFKDAVTLNEPSLVTSLMLHGNNSPSIKISFNPLASTSSSSASLLSKLVYGVEILVIGT